jgi:phospholipid/cholesterol/gamma-HCH transport system substrate-binding protein
MDGWFRRAASATNRVMETSSNRYLVFGVVAVMLAALFAYISWASPGRPPHSRLYEIRFDRSVAGLARNSAITLQGVAIGRVDDIRFARADPEIIRVRVLITNRHAPILEGTTAELNRDLFGVALIRLSGAPAGAPSIVAKGNELPIIPLKKGGAFLDDPVSMVESIAVTTDKLNRALDPAGQATISEMIAKLERRSGRLAAAAPKLADSLANARSSIRGGGQAAREIGAMVATVNRQMQQSKDMAADLHQSLANAREGLKAIDARVAEARPKVQALNDLELHSKVREMRSATAEIKETVQRVEVEGIGALTATPVLPDYQGK